MTYLPKARTENIVVQDLPDELLIYDKATDQAYSLNKTSKVVFNSCDGVMTFAELKRTSEFTDELIYLALDELKKQNLIEGDYASPFTGLKRREVIRKVGLASLIALPAISSLVAPSAANAGSRGQDNGTTCATRTTSSTECKSGRCIQTRVFTYNPATAVTTIRASGLKCCGNTTEDVTGSFAIASSACNFSRICCTGSGSTTYDALHDLYYCTCDATS